MDSDLKEILLKGQIEYLRNSVENYLIKNKITQEERKGVEKFRDWQIEEIEKMLEKLNSR